MLLRDGAHSDCLREAVSTLSRRLTNTIVPWNDIQTLMSNHLITLDKCPGVRPVGIGETVSHMIGKMVCTATRLDLAVQCETDQLCGGSSVEFKVRFMRCVVCLVSISLTADVGPPCLCYKCF